MLVTPALALLSLAFNFGTLLLLHGSDPNFVTTRRNLQNSIQTIELAATETWSAIAVHYNDILSPPPASSSSSSFPLVDHAEWIYRSCVVRILRSLDGPVSRSSRTPSPSPSLVSSPSLSSYSSTTDLTTHTPLPPTCSIFNAPFIVDHVEHPLETLGFMEINFPRFWPLALCILVSLAVCIRFKDHHPSDISDFEIEPAYEAQNIDPVAGHARTDSDSTPSLSSELGVSSKSRGFPTTADTTLPSLPIVVTTSRGRVLFNAEITLSSNQIFSTSPSSLEFSVDVAVFRNYSSSPFDDGSAGSEKHILILGGGESDIEFDISSVSSADHADIIFDKVEDSEETTSISDAAGASTSSSDQVIDAPTKVTEDLHTPNSTTAETAPEPRIEWSTEDTDIGEPPVYMLAGIEVDDDDGWEISVNGRHGGLQNGNRARSDSRQGHETSLGLTQYAFGTKDWSRKGGMDVPGSIDPSAQTGPRPIRDLIPAGSGPTAQSDPPFTGGKDPAGRDQTATSPSSNDGDGTMPSPLNRSDRILDCCLLSGSTLVGGVSSTGADGVAGAAEAIGECSASMVSSNQSLPPSISPPPSTTASPLSPSLLALPSMAFSRASVFVPGPIRHLITTTNDDYSGQPRRVIVDNIDSSTVAVADPTYSFSCRLLEDALQDLEIEAINVRCFDGRVVGGVARYGVSYAVIDFTTHMDALIAVRQLRSYDPEGRWLAEFSDPNDGTFGGRMADGFLPASRSVRSLRVLQDLAAQLDLCEN